MLSIAEQIQARTNHFTALLGVRLPVMNAPMTQAAGPAMAAAVYGAGQGTGQLLGQRQSFFRKGKIGAGHWSAPLRNSVVKLG